ncbi:MAG: GLPGLI family protein [Phycisphaerales bacterium]|nr:GLPGLI family protein [Phycisphaerales bacterium]
MKSIILSSVLVMTCLSLVSKGQVILQGKIEYQRKMNIHRQFDDMSGDNNSYMEAFIAKIPKFDTRNFALVFNSKQSKYSPVKHDENPMLAMMGGLPGTETVVWNDLEHQKTIASKKVYEQAFLVDDNIRKYTWKILEEVRTIAGFSCRKAVTKINDSVVVVAFYTDKISVSSGPEMFAGLPGMIMELAIPRLFTTWVAQSVVLETVAPDQLTVPEKGKKTTIVDMEKSIRSSTKSWGKFADKSIWWSNL